MTVFVISNLNGVVGVVDSEKVAKEYAANRNEMEAALHYLKRLHWRADQYTLNSLPSDADYVSQRDQP